MKWKYCRKIIKSEFTFLFHLSCNIELDSSSGSIAKVIFCSESNCVWILTCLDGLVSIFDSLSFKFWTWSFKTLNSWFWDFSLFSKALTWTTNFELFELGFVLNCWLCSVFEAISANMKINVTIHMTNVSCHHILINGSPCCDWNFVNQLTVIKCWMTLANWV